MGIERIKLGPKSRFVEQVDEAKKVIDGAGAADLLREGGAEKLKRLAYDQVVQDVLKQPSDAAVAEAAGLLGCGCGRERLATRDALLEVDGIIHRHGRPCFRSGESKQAGAMSPPERAGRAGDQGLPHEGKGDIILSVVEQLMERRRLGVRRYGRALQAFNGRDAYRDHLDELLDAAAYAEQLRLEHRAVCAALCALARFVREKHERTGVVDAALGLAAALERIP